MTNVKNYAILSLTVLVLFWSVEVRSRLVKLQAEGRIDKIDVAGPIDPSVKVGANFLFVLSYDTEKKGTFLVRGLTVDSVGHLPEDEVYYCRAYYSSKVGDWGRLKFAIETIKSSDASRPGINGRSIDVKLAFDSRITGDLGPSVTQTYHLPLKNKNISLASGEVFFHLVYVHKGGAEGLISGEITSLIKLDG